MTTKRRSSFLPCMYATAIALAVIVSCSGVDCAEVSDDAAAQPDGEGMRAGHRRRRDQAPYTARAPNRSPNARTPALHLRRLHCQSRRTVRSAGAGRNAGKPNNDR
ncbi:unnamed protein product [Urochloa humidicola]